MSADDAARQRQIKHRIVRDLLASTQERLEREPGRPRSTVLRRAVSKADYDPRRFTRGKSDVLLIVALAEEAVSPIENLPDEPCRRLAVHLIAKPRRP